MQSRGVCSPIGWPSQPTKRPQQVCRSRSPRERHVRLPSAHQGCPRPAPLDPIPVTPRVYKVDWRNFYIFFNVFQRAYFDFLICAADWTRVLIKCKSSEIICAIMKFFIALVKNNAYAICSSLHTKQRVITNNELFIDPK